MRAFVITLFVLQVLSFAWRLKEIGGEYPKVEKITEWTALIRLFVSLGFAIWAGVLVL